jgi:hypothetical protein
MQHQPMVELNNINEQKSSKNKKKHKRNENYCSTERNTRASRGKSPSQYRMFQEVMETAAANGSLPKRSRRPVITFDL